MMSKVEKNCYIEEDALRCSQCSYIPWEKLKDRKVLVTGATGLIGSSIIKILLHINEWRALKLSIFAMVRSAEKAKSVFGKNIDKLISVYWGGA